MEFPRSTKDAGQWLGDLKDRFGFGGGSRNRYDSYDDRGYDDYDSASDSYDAQFGYDPDQYGDPYDRLEYTTRSSGRSYGHGSSVSSNLVTSGDIRRASSRVASHDSGPIVSLPSIAPAPEPEPAPVAGFDVPSTSQSDFVSPYQAHTPQTSYTTGAVSTGNTGLDSLFTPTTPAPEPATPPIASSPTVSLSVERTISVVEPRSYEELSSVASSVRAGSIVVLALKSTDAALTKRALDFSFGVAAALDARVECIADKTFVLCTGSAPSDAEMQKLKAQGLA